MTAVSVTLIIIGIICVVLSIVLNFDNTKESQKQLQTELTKEQQEKIKKQVQNLIDNELDTITERTESSLDKISNTKILEMSEYAENVLGEINRNHNETIFLYDMLNEKAKEIKSTVKDVNITKRQVEKIHAEVKASDKPDEEESVKNEETSNLKDEARQRLVDLVKVSDSNKDKNLNMRKTQAEELERKKVASEVDKEVFKVVDFATEKENIALSEEKNPFSEVKSDIKNIAHNESKLKEFSAVKEAKEVKKEKSEDNSDDILAGFVFEDAPAVVNKSEIKKEVKKTSKAKADISPKKSTTRKTTTKKTSANKKVETLKKNINEVEFDASENNNDRILKLSGLGFSNKDIAKYLNLGIGEVKLVVDLYKETK